MTTSHEPWEGLRDSLLEALERSAPAPWYEIWNLYCDDPWYQAELSKHARSVLASGGAPLDWLDDIRQEGVLILAKKLQKLPGLGLNIRELGDRFPNVFGTIIRNSCRQALKRHRRIYGTGQSLIENADLSAVKRLFEAQERSLDVSAAIDELPEPERSVLRLYQLGNTIREISRQLGLTYFEAYRAFRRGVKRIKGNSNSP